MEHRNDHLSELDEATSEIPAKVNSVAVMLYTYIELAEHVWWFDFNLLSHRQGILICQECNYQKSILFLLFELLCRLALTIYYYKKIEVYLNLLSDKKIKSNQQTLLI